jgi:ribonucleoside-diphosphate reductase alpha chain
MRRPKKLSGTTQELVTGCGKIFITINTKNDLPYELFAVMGKGGGCASSQCEALGRTISLALKASVPVKDLIKHLAGISCHMPSGVNEDKVLSCADAIAKCLKLFEEENKKGV